METHEQNIGNCRQWDFPLTRRLVLRLRCARPELAGQKLETRNQELQYRNGLKRWQRAARFRRTLDVVKRRTYVRSASLERGSAATRTVVRSISSVARQNELTHISRINRR
jgi:hypothetical protein